MIKFMLVAALALSLLATANAVDAVTPLGSGEAMLSGENQVPTPVLTETVAMFSANATTKNVKWKLEIFDVVNFTMAHIHLGNATTNGPPIVYLVPIGNAATNATLPVLARPRTGTSMVFTGSFRASEVGPPLNGTTMPDLLNTFAAGEAYVNLHTVEFPAGVVRGQIEWQADV